MSMRKATMRSLISLPDTPNTESGERWSCNTLSGRKRYVRMDGLDPPRIASQVEQYARMLPELLEFIDESVLQIVERRENGIGEGLAQMAENLLSWVQFWTVGREIERMHIVWPAHLIAVMTART